MKDCDIDEAYKNSFTVGGCSIGVAASEDGETILMMLTIANSIGGTVGQWVIMTPSDLNSLLGVCDVAADLATQRRDEKSREKP